MDKLIKYRDSQIYYQIAGNGDAVVLLHGFLEDHSIWNSLAEKLCINHTVIAIDLPGFGKSDVIADIHPMELMADIVNQVVISENITKFIVVGHSMGGYVSLAFADLFPNKLDGIVLFHSQAGSDDEEAKLNRNRTIQIVEKDHSKFIGAFIPTLFAEENISKFKNEINHLTRISSATSDKGIIAALAGMRDRKDYRETLKRINVPILFIIGKQDSKISLENINQQIILPNHSESLILGNVGHMGFIESEKITASAIISFIEKIYQY